MELELYVRRYMLDTVVLNCLSNLERAPLRERPSRILLSYVQVGRYGPCESLFVIVGVGKTKEIPVSDGELALVPYRAAFGLIVAVSGVIAAGVCAHFLSPAYWYYV